MLSRILVAVSGSPASMPKLRAALELAQRHGARLTALSVIDVERLRQVGPVPLGAEHHAEHWRERRVEEAHAAAEGALAEFVAMGERAGVPVRILSREGDPVDLMIDAWRYQDLCILGARSWFDHDLVPEPADALLKLVAAGVRPLLAATERSGPVRRALVAYNGSLESAKAMKQFAQMRLWPDAALHVVCVGAAKTGEAPDQVLQDAADYCRGQGYTCTSEHVDGVPREVLLRQAAAHDADLIVLGSSFRKVLTMQRFGVNAMTLLRESDRPLFLSA